MPTTIVNTGNRRRALKTRYTAYITETNVTGVAQNYDSIPAPGEGKNIVIMAMSLSSNATVVVTFRSDSTDVGSRPTTINAPIEADGGDYGLFELGEDEKLVVGLNGNANIAGWITYIIEGDPA